MDGRWRVDTLHSLGPLSPWLAQRSACTCQGCIGVGRSRCWGFGFARQGVVSVRPRGIVHLHPQQHQLGVGALLVLTVCIRAVECVQ